MRAKKTDTVQRKRQIVNAAMDLIGAEGIHGLSISGVAARVGIVPSAVYRHFAGKEDVLDAVLALLRKKLLDNVDAVRQETLDPIERLQLLLTRHLKMLSQNPALPYVIFSDTMYAGYPERKRHVHAMISAYLEEIAEIMREGQREGKIQSDIDLSSAALLFLGMILPAGMFVKLSPHPINLMNHARNVWPVFERGLTSGSTRNRAP